MIRSSSSAAGATETEQTMAHVTQSVRAVAPDLVAGLRAKGYFVMDDFLTRKFCETLRNEAAVLYEAGHFVTSQSTRWCSVENKAVYYDKHNVYSMQLLGGETYYQAPRLHEYIVAAVKAIVPELQRGFPEARLSSVMASNKLAVCVGDGSAYDKHYDNSGLDDVRKVTILYYMNPNYRSELGGQFRIYNPAGAVPETTDIEPLGDRLLVFWSDLLVHSVEPSFAPGGVKDHRYALTLWLTADSPDAIVRDDLEIARHFGP